MGAPWKLLGIAGGAVLGFEGLKALGRLPEALGYSKLYSPDELSEKIRSDPATAQAVKMVLEKNGIDPETGQPLVHYSDIQAAYEAGARSAYEEGNGNGGPVIGCFDGNRVLDQLRKDEAAKEDKDSPRADASSAASNNRTIPAVAQARWSGNV